MDDIARGSTATKELLSLSNLSVGYGGHPVIAGIDLTMRRGDILGLLGANGSGKSTLIKSITGQLRPQTGAITIDGIDLARTPDRDLLARLGVAAWLDRTISEYSLGTRAKIAIAAALLGSPPLLIFDESLNGLDPVAAWEVKSLLMELATSGRHAVIISTHVVEMVPNLCNRAVFLAEGKITRSWDIDDLTQTRAAPSAFEAGLVSLLKSQLQTSPGK